MKISKEDREKLRRSMPWGMQSEIARRCGMSRNMVSVWLRGKVENKAIERTALALMADYLRGTTEEKRLYSAVFDRL